MLGVGSACYKRASVPLISNACKQSVFVSDAKEGCRELSTSSIFHTGLDSQRKATAQSPPLSLRFERLKGRHAADGSFMFAIIRLKKSLPAEDRFASLSTTEVVAV